MKLFMFRFIIVVFFVLATLYTCTREGDETKAETTASALVMEHWCTTGNPQCYLSTYSPMAKEWE